jgi:WD40 repeat protein
MTETAPLPSASRGDVPRSVDAVVRKLMARDPVDRFQTPADLIVEIDRLVRAKMAPPAAPAPAAPAAVGAPAAPVAPSHVRAHPGGIRALALSADGKWLLSGGMDEALRLWPGGRLQEVRCIAGDVGPVQGIALAPNAKWCASCALRLFKPDMVVQLWDLSTGQERRRLRGHSDILHAVAISPDGRRVASGSADRTIRIHAIDKPGSPSLCLTGHTATVTAVVFLPAGDTLLSASQDGTVRLWDAKTGAARGSVGAQVGQVAAIAYGGPTKQLAMAGSGVRLRQMDGTFIELLGAGQVSSLAYSRDGRLVLTGGKDRVLRVWRAGDGIELHRFEAHTDLIHAVALSPDGRTAFSGGADGALRCWPIPD